MDYSERGTLRPIGWQLLILVEQVARRYDSPDSRPFRCIGAAGRRLLPSPLHGREQPVDLSGRTRSGGSALLPVHIAPSSLGGPPRCVHEWTEPGLQPVLQRQPGRVRIDGRWQVSRLWQSRPGNDHDPMPDFGRKGVCEVMAFANGQVPQSAFGIGGLTDVQQSPAKPDTVYDLTGHVRPVMADHQRTSELVREFVAPLTPRARSRLGGGDPLESPPPFVEVGDRLYPICRPMWTEPIRQVTAVNKPGHTARRGDDGRAWRDAG